MSGTKSPAILSRRRLSRSALPETPRRGVVNDLHKVCLVTGQGTERPVQDFLHRRYGRFASRPSSHDVTGDIIDRESIREVVVVNVSGSKYSVGELLFFFCLFECFPFVMLQLALWQRSSECLSQETILMNGEANKMTPTVM